MSGRLRQKEDGWAVEFPLGRLCSPRWHEPGPARAYLEALRRGLRRPEHSGDHREERMKPSRRLVRSARAQSVEARLEALRRPDECPASEDVRNAMSILDDSASVTLGEPSSVTLQLADFGRALELLRRAVQKLEGK
jgi:hypothetical protein